MVWIGQAKDSSAIARRSVELGGGCYAAAEDGEVVVSDYVLPQKCGGCGIK